MGWNIGRFIDIDRVLDDFICVICTDVVENPVQTPCEHIFCRDCIMEWLISGKNSCPVDRKPLKLDNLNPVNRMTIQLLNKLIIRCKNYSEGCFLMATLENMSNLIRHEKDYCANVQNIRAQGEIDELKETISQLEDELSFERDSWKELHSERKENLKGQLNFIKEMDKKIKGLSDMLNEKEKGLAASSAVLDSCFIPVTLGMYLFQSKY